MNLYRTIFSVLFVLLFCGCSDEVDYGVGEYRVDWVEVHSGSLFSLLDNQGTLLSSNNFIRGLDEGDLAILNYTPIKQTADGYTIAINGAVLVQKFPITLQDRVSPDLNDDSITLESCWIGRNYLNISCYIDVYKANPTVILVYQGVDDDNTTHHFSYQHSKNEDQKGSRAKTHLSFDLSQVMGEPRGDKMVLVTFKTGEPDQKKTVELEY